MRSADGEHEYRIFIAWPSEPAPQGGFPVIYVLDANASFCTMVEAIRMRCHRPHTTGVVPAVVVGIAHATDGPYDRDRRRLDFSAGGSSAFDELLDRVIDTVERDYAIDPTRRVLFGHSLAGSFVLDALLGRPERFQTYLAVSPSLWLDWERLLTRVDRFARPASRAAVDVRVMLSVGELEETIAPWEVGTPSADEIAQRRSSRRMVSRCRELADRLRSAPDVEVRFDEFAGEDHASVVIIAISRALRFALRDRCEKVVNDLNRT